MGVLTQYETDIGGLDSALVNKIGTATLTTAAQNLSGAVNELDAELGNETLPDPSKTVKGNINSIKQSLSDLAEKKIIREKLTLSSDSNGFALTTFTTSGYQILSASGKGFGCLPFDGGGGYWYILFINVQTWAKYPNLSNKEIWITYQVL